MNIPTPADPVMDLARECAATEARKLGHYVTARKIEAGEADHSPAVQSALAAIRATTEGIADDYMTSEHHHPGYVLIPTATFERLARLANKHIKGSDDAQL